MQNGLNGETFKMSRKNFKNASKREKQEGE